LYYKIVVQSTVGKTTDSGRKGDTQSYEKHANVDPNPGMSAQMAKRFDVVLRT